MDYRTENPIDAPTVRSSLGTAFSAFKRSLRIRIGALVLAIALISLALRMFVGPGDGEGFPKVVTVPGGTTLRQTAALMEQAGVIGAPIVFKDLVILMGGEGGVQAGDYYFERPMSAFSAARRFTEGESGVDPVRVTIPEGSDVDTIADILEKNLLTFDREAFIELAREHEGYLFPDTYHLAQSDPAGIIELMRDNFERKIEPLEHDIERFGRSLSDIIIMASILEGEARTMDSRQMVAGILWKRISISMPLQVDAAFRYVNGKTTFGLTTEDLRTDHPYNTYTNLGLPPGPINNPGIAAIKAAISPTVSPYLYYLTDTKGNMRYAKTHDEHVRNKQVYLR